MNKIFSVCTIILLLAPALASAQYYTDPTIGTSLQGINNSLQGINESLMYNQMMGPNSIPAQGVRDLQQRSYGIYEPTVQQSQTSQCPAGTVNYYGSCVTPNQGCVLKYGQGASFTNYTANGLLQCGCVSGYDWNNAQSACVMQQQCASGTVLYGSSCVSLDTYCKDTAAASERDRVFAKGYNSDGTVNCLVSFAGTGAAQQQVQPALAPTPKPVAQTKKTVSPQAPAPKFYVDDHPDATITTTTEPTTTPPQHHGFLVWLLSLLGW